MGEAVNSHVEESKNQIFVGDKYLQINGYDLIKLGVLNMKVGNLIKIKYDNTFIHCELPKNIMK